jgi:hypothetical protein
MTVLRSIGPALVLAATLLAAAPTAAAQDLTAADRSPTETAAEVPTDVEVWTDNIDRQLAHLLESPAPGTRAKAMKLVVHYGNLEADPVNLTRTVPHLLDIYRSGETDGERILALSALSATGSPTALRKVAEGLRGEADGRVRQHALRILTVHQRAQQ